MILGIETSCDETAVAVYDIKRGLLAHLLHSQVKVHEQHGGVVPELASRDHIRHIAPLTDQVLKKANIKKTDLTAIAYTAGPGLIGALMVGVAFAKSLAWALDIPSIAVHHLEGHLLAPMLEEKKPQGPFVALLVSGGHTMLMQVNAIGDYKLLGESLDDAAGEAFDKTAKLLGLGYPGGPAIAKLAAQATPPDFKFPRPMVNRPGLDFSFSGLKTYVRNAWQTSDQNETTRAQIAYAFQAAVVDTLLIKCKRALQQTDLKQLVVAGGVSANQALRAALNTYGAQENINIYYPRHEFCTDNAAMIAYAGAYHFQQNHFDSDLSIQGYARWPLAQKN